MLSNEIWNTIIKFNSINQINELRFLCSRFKTSSTFFKKNNYYGQISHKIFDTDNLYKLSLKLYNEVLFKKLMFYFNFTDLCYLKYRLEPVKNLFMCSNVFSDLFNCPRYVCTQ